MARVTLDTDARWLVIGMAGLAVATNVGVAFLAGAGAHRAYEWWREGEVTAGDVLVAAD